MMTPKGFWLGAKESLFNSYFPLVVCFPPLILLIAFNTLAVPTVSLILAGWYTGHLPITTGLMIALFSVLPLSKVHLDGNAEVLDDALAAFAAACVAEANVWRSVRLGLSLWVALLISNTKSLEYLASALFDSRDVVHRNVHGASRLSSVHLFHFVCIEKGNLRYSATIEIH